MHIAEIRFPEQIRRHRPWLVAGYVRDKNLGQRSLTPCLLEREHRWFHFFDLTGQYRFALLQIVQQNDRLDQLPPSAALGHVLDQVGQAHGRRTAELPGRRKHGEEEMGGSLSGSEFHVAQPLESLRRIRRFPFFSRRLSVGMRAVRTKRAETRSARCTPRPSNGELPITPPPPYG